MSDLKGTVFISYRRKTSKYPALLVYKALSQNGYDVFIDYESIDSGKFAQEILNQIAARGHFIPILSPGCLDRTVNPNDWLRKEIEYAIDTQRNIIPLLFDGFRYEDESQFLTGKLAALSDYNSLTVPDGYFDEAMTKLQKRFLKQIVRGIVKPTSKADKAFAKEVMQNAEKSVDEQIKPESVAKYLRTILAVRPQAQINTSLPTKRRGADYLYARVFQTPATKELLGRDPLEGEKVIAIGEAKRVGMPEMQLRDEKGLLILTTKRLIFKANINVHSFEMGRVRLSEGPHTSRHKDNGYEVMLNSSYGVPRTLWLPKSDLYNTLKKELNFQEE